MGVASTIAALQAINAAITGITSAPTTRPIDVMPASLPCIIVRPGALQMAYEGRESVTKTRTYEAVCLVVAPNQGRGVAEGLAKTQTIMDAVSAAYEAHIEAAGGLSTGGIVTGYRDSGEPQSLIGYGASEYEGFTFSVDVWEG